MLPMNLNVNVQKAIFSESTHGREMVMSYSRLLVLSSLSFFYIIIFLTLPYILHLALPTSTLSLVTSLCLILRSFFTLFLGCSFFIPCFSFYSFPLHHIPGAPYLFSYPVLGHFILSHPTFFFTFFFGCSFLFHSSHSTLSHSTILLAHHTASLTLFFVSSFCLILHSFLPCPLAVPLLPCAASHSSPYFTLSWP